MRGALTFLVLSALPSIAHAYPTFIRLGYVSCTSCHISPQGAGQLTEYGKGMGDGGSAIVRDYQPPSASWYEAVTLSGRVQHGMQARALGFNAGNRTEVFLMQLDYQNSTQVSDAMRLDAVVGLIPSRMVQSGRSGSGALGESLVLKKFVGAYRPSDGLEFAAGRDYLPTGLNIEDHTSFLRSNARRGVFDYSTLARADLWSESGSLSPFLFAPSYEENPNNREAGGGFRAERLIGTDKTMGVSGLYGMSPALRRLTGSLFSRVGFTPRVGLLSEYQYTRREVQKGASFNQHVLHLRPFVLPLEWLETGVVGEMMLRSAPFRDEAFQFGPSINARIVRELSLNLDARFTARGSQTQRVLSMQMVGRI